MTSRIRPAAKIFVAERGNTVSRGLICRDEVDIAYRPDVLTAFFFRKPTHKILDLLRVLAVVAHADRRVPRRHSICWGRDLELDIPVSDPEFWRGTEDNLCALLALLSGDSWSFSFRKPKSDYQVPDRGYLEFPANGEFATAYSNGLDSFAVARLVASGEVRLSNGLGSKKNLVLVTTGQNIHLSDSYAQFGYRVRQVSVPFAVRRFGKRFRLREISYRTRAFTFQTLAALAAVQAGSNTVVVGEAGQGSLGPWLTVTGDEVADLRTHPYFTESLSQFLAKVLEVKVRFEHPLIWTSKGQALRLLVSAKLHEGWEETRSCAVQARHQQTSGLRLQCGLCPNCILRRQSLLTAGLPDVDSNYDYACEGSDSQSLKRRAAQGLMPLIELASVRADPLASQVVDNKVEQFAVHQRMLRADAKSRIDSLIRAHTTELQAFIESRPKRSLLREIGEAIL